MSIATQLHRGYLALPLLLLFAALASAATLRETPSPAAYPEARLPEAGSCEINVIRLRLASAPGDLPQRPTRLSIGCRG